MAIQGHANCGAGGWYGTGPVASLAAYLLAGLRSPVIKGCSAREGSFSCFFLFLSPFLLGDLSDTMYLCGYHNAKLVPCRR